MGEEDNISQRHKETKDTKIFLVEAGMTENEISKQVVDAAYKIHYRYGPGLLETPYEMMMARELRKRRIRDSTAGSHPIDLRRRTD